MYHKFHFLWSQVRKKKYWKGIRPSCNPPPPPPPPIFAYGHITFLLIIPSRIKPRATRTAQQASAVTLMTFHWETK